MTQIDQTTHDWTGRTVRSRDGAKLGRLTEVFDESADGRGTWGVVRSTLGRRKLVPLDDATPDDRRGLQVPVDRASLRSAPAAGTVAPDPQTHTALHDHYHGRRVLADAQLRRREQFGGMKPGAAFFGWLVAVGLAVLLAGIVVAVTAGLGPAGPPSALAASVAAVAVLVVAYYAGGYVAGRLARFDGARNGLLTWVIGVLITVIAAIAAGTGDARFNLLTQAQLPVAPLSVEQLTVGGILTVIAIVVGTLVAAMLGGKAGERYHHKIDRAGIDDL